MDPRDGKEMTPFRHSLAGETPELCRSVAADCKTGYTDTMGTADTLPGYPTRRAGRDAHAWQASDTRDLARGVRVAKRHSRSVRFLRIAVPAGVVLAGVVATLMTWFNPLRVLAQLPHASGRLAVSGSKIMMEAPRLTGYTRDGRSYEMTAKSALQDVFKPDILELNTIHGKMDQADRTAIDLTAVSGVYDRATEMLVLNQYIVLNSTSGYESHLTEALVDVRKSYIVSNKPVEVLLSDGVLKADRMEVIDDGDLIRFEGNVQMNMNGKSAPAPDKASQ
jgi:lipopolysaccharide export system protein LptC